MQQHPVPQHISSYEFKLVGDMTLKQFFQLAGGLVISLIFYATPLPGFIKWPLVIIFGLAGAALAFLPIEERPLSQWVFAFIKAIYSPTIYTWDATSAEDVFAKGSSTTPDPSINIPVANSQIEQTEEVQRFEAGEKNFFSKVTAMFAGVPHVATSNTTLDQQAAIGAPTRSSSEPFAQGTVLTQETEGAKNAPQPAAQTRIMEMAIPVPASAPTKIEPTPAQTQQQTQGPETPGQLTPVFSGQANASQAQQAVFAPEAAPPAPPERPNTIVGQIITSEGKIVEGAIMEIRDASTKTPVRALRSNRVGHFITVTPVQNGIYEIITEKEGLTFDPIQFSAEGRLIPPIQIKAKQ